MKKYKIEVSNNTKAVVCIELIAIVAICVEPLITAFNTKDLITFIVVPIFFSLSWIFIRVFYLNVTIDDVCFSYNIFNHSKFTISLKDIIFVRLGNENDFIERGHPVYSKNLIVIEYFNHKKSKKMKSFYLSLKPEDLTSFMDEMKTKCNYVV